MFGFEKLDVYQLAQDYAEQVYQRTRTFPNDERFGLTNQVRRSAVSIAAIIAEGSGRGSNKDFIRFLQIAYGSLMECVSHFQIALRQGFIQKDAHTTLYRIAQRLSRMLSGLRTSLSNQTP